MSANNPSTASSNPTQQTGRDAGPAGADLGRQNGIEAGLPGTTKRVRQYVPETGVCESTLASRIFRASGLSWARYMLCEEDVYLICLHGPLVGIVFTGRCVTGVKQHLVRKPCTKKGNWTRLTGRKSTEPIRYPR